jgi:muramoyltetrapeptide carboxypeptidase
MLKPRALAPGDRIAVVAPASPFARDQFELGIAELRALGFVPVYDESVFARDHYVAGPASVRAAAWLRAWSDPSIAALIAARGGYGSVQLLDSLDPNVLRRTPKAFIGYSDNTSLMTWLTLRCGIVTYHGPMLEGRLARADEGYDRDTFERCLCRTEPVGAIADGRLEVVRAGEAEGVLTGGTLTLLAASLGTPYAFMPPEGCILFLEDVAERPYKLDRMLTQMRLAGVLNRASALVFGEMRNCDEPDGSTTARAVVGRFAQEFPGPVLFGLPSGHTTGPTMTLPFGVRARVLAGSPPALIIDEPAVTPRS